MTQTILRCVWLVFVFGLSSGCRMQNPDVNADASSATSVPLDKTNSYDVVVFGADHEDHIQTFPWHEGNRVLDALAHLKDTPRLSNKLVQLGRSGDASARPFVVVSSYDNILKDRTDVRNCELQPGDTILVDPPHGRGVQKFDAPFERLLKAINLSDE